MLNLALKLLRVFHELKQKELAEKLDISASHISEIEAGKKTPTLELLNTYARVFEVPPSSILFLAENLESGISPGRIQSFVSPKVLAMINFVAERSGGKSVLKP